MRGTDRVLALATVATLVLLAFSAHTAGAFELWSNGPASVDLNLSVKSTSILSHAPGDTVYYPKEWSAASLWRFRAVLEARPNDRVNAQLAYEQRARTVSEGAGAAGGAGVLPVDIDAPYRISQLDDVLVEVGSTFSYAHELDRAVVSAYVGRADIKVGRQAVGWGRGVLFGAVDIFAPFSPLESDREWRRGIDAVRVRMPVTDLISVDGVAALGESSDESAYVGRVHGYIGDIDGELLAGTRCEDGFYGASMSLPLLDAEFHGEAAVFVSPDVLPAGGSFGSDDVAVKAVVGGSRSFDLASGLLVAAEYHYSGFGVTDIDDLADYSENEAYRERYTRGDSQIVGRHACALQLSYGFAGLTPLSATWVVSPVDGSGVIIPSVVWVFSDSVTLSASGYIAHGDPPDGPRIRSEYGGTPSGGLVQISFYY